MPHCLVYENSSCSFCICDITYSCMKFTIFSCFIYVDCIFYVRNSLNLMSGAQALCLHAYVVIYKVCYVQLLVSHLLCQQQIMWERREKWQWHSAHDPRHHHFLFSFICCYCYCLLFLRSHSVVCYDLVFRVFMCMINNHAKYYFVVDCIDFIVILVIIPVYLNVTRVPLYCNGSQNT